MKHLISVILCAVFFFTMFFVPASALPLSAGDDSLRAAFLSGEGGGLTYKYFVPENRTGRSYPVVVWLHGIASGSYDGDQLDSYDLCKWASDEFQSRFANAGGAYILCPRAKGTWDTTPGSAVRNCIEEFISDRAPYADRSRIYLTGFSLGASMAVKTAADNPGYFAAVVPISAIDRTAANRLTDTAVWLFANEKDTYLSANADAVRLTFNLLAKNANDPSKIRFTKVSEAVYPNGRRVETQHYMWRIFTNDMFMSNGTQYAYSETVDGTGRTVNFTNPDGIISWLSLQTSSPVETQRQSFFEKIIRLFRDIINFITNIFRK